MDLKKLQEGNELTTAITQLKKLRDLLENSRVNSMQIHIDGNDYPTLDLSIVSTYRVRNALTSMKVDLTNTIEAYEKEFGAL